MRERVNLATRPFRNETTPVLLFALAWTVALGLTAVHARTVRRLTSASVSALQGEARALEAESARLREEAARLRGPAPGRETVARWARLKELVDRRTFSWSGLLSVLEEALPRDVRLVSIAPDVREGEVRLEIVAVARSVDAGLEFVKVLEDRPEFSDVFPLGSSVRPEGSEFRYHLRYRPLPRAAGGVRRASS